MFFRILKKDLKRKKGINFILFIFMIMATLFVASSVNNILVVTNAIDYCMEKGNIPDEYIAAMDQKDGRNITDWLDGDGSKYIKDYSVNDSIFISQGNIKTFTGKKDDSTKYQIDNSIMLCKQADKHMFLFDEENTEKKLELGKGEIAVQPGELKNNDMKIGDTIILKFGDCEKIFTITNTLRDPAFDGDYVGMTRYLISDEDYNEIAASGVDNCYNICVDTDNISEFKHEFNKQGYSVVINIDGSMFAFSYVAKMISAGILIIVGVCLILISFLILRFTIIFTLKEDFKEIGIMKAIGLRSFGIRSIYLIKYLILITGASIIGCILSIPVSDIMLKGISSTMLTENGSSNIGLNILCSIGVMIVVILLCYICTGKLKKFTVIEAIRSGETGERFSKRRGISLHRTRKLHTPLYMAVNDILSNMKRFVVLMLTFAIGTIIIILPLNTLETFGSKEMAKNFSLDTEADFYISADSTDDTETDTVNDYNKIRTNVEKIKEDLLKNGYNSEINTLIYYTFAVYTNDKDNIDQVVGFQPMNCDGKYIELVSGSTPKLENEIGMSEMQMKSLGVDIGDKVHVIINGNDKEFIITAKYQNYIQMGKSMFINSNVDLQDCTVTGTWYYQVHLNNKDNIDKKTIIKNVSKDMPQYKIYDMKGAMESQLGSTVSQMNSIKIMIIALICVVNILITILMVKIFIIGERSQIGMLRSIGYSKREIRKWQVIRIGIVQIIAELIGMILSLGLNNLALKPIFGMMGATHIKITVNAMEVYLIYPAILLIVTLIAADISAMSIKKLNIMEINNAE